LVYRAYFTLLPNETIDPLNEDFRIQVDSPTTPMIDLALAPGELQPSTPNVVSFSSREGSLRRVDLREVAPSHYVLRVLARSLTVPLPDDLDITVTLTFGDDTLTEPISLLVKDPARKYIGLK
jgi:hypothetical protein